MFQLEQIKRVLEEHGGWFAVFSVLLLLPAKNLYKVPLVLMAFAGVYLLWRQRDRIVEWVPLRLLWLLFLAIWLPMLLSLFGGGRFDHGLGTVAVFPLYFFAALCMVYLMRDGKARRRLLLAVVVYLSFLALDGIAQYYVGFNLFGYPYEAGRINGMFSPKWRLGHVLAVLLPVYLEGLRYWAKERIWLWMLVIPYLYAIVLSSSRTSWLMSFIALAGYALLLLYTVPKRLRLRLIVLLLVALVAVFSIAAQQETVRSRVVATAGVLSGEFERIDIATARRASIWVPGVDMVADNWANGVGLRGFRHHYLDYAADDSYWKGEVGVSPTHPHLVLLEVAIETGLPGVLGLLLFLILLFRYALRSGGGALLPAAWLLSVMIAFFPLNTHVSFYGSYWTGVSWWLLAIALAMLSGYRRDSSSA